MTALEKIEELLEAYSEYHCFLLNETYPVTCCDLIGTAVDWHGWHLAEKSEIGHWFNSRRLFFAVEADVVGTKNIKRYSYCHYLPAISFFNLND